MLHLGHRHCVVLDSEVGHAGVLAAEIGDQWIVGVQHQPGVARGPCENDRPPVGDRLELAVAIELVAEQVPEQQRSRGELLGHRRQPELVDLEQPELAVDTSAGARGGEQRRGDPSGHVRAGAVVHERDAGPFEHRRNHRGARRLAVRRRDDHCPPGQARRELGDRLRLEAHQHLAGEAGAAAPARAPGERPDRASGGELRSDRGHRGTMTRTARGSALTVTGSSAIGSPSAYIVIGRSALTRSSRARRTDTPGWLTSSPLNALGR